MDRNKVEKAFEVLKKYEAIRFGEGIFVPYHIRHAIQYLNESLATSNAGPIDECECERCKTTEPAPHEAAGDYSPGFWRYLDTTSDRLFVRVSDDRNTTISTVDDYEIRVKAWNIALDFAWEDVDDEFSATLDAATKLYNFLSGQNEDTK